MQWMLDLTLYRDNAGEIDSATQGVASAVFWPLIGCTLAAAGFTMYARAKRDGGGSILGEAVKVAVLGVLAISFVMAPSKIVAPTGRCPHRRVERDHDRATPATTWPRRRRRRVPARDRPVGPRMRRPARLADSMWSTFIVTPWCYAAFGGEDLCGQWGQDYITRSDKWKQIAAHHGGAPTSRNGMQPGSKPDNCVAEFADNCDTVRGVTMDRLASRTGRRAGRDPASHACC